MLIIERTNKIDSFEGFKNALIELEKEINNKSKEFFNPENLSILKEDIAQSIKKGELDNFIETNYRSNLNKILQFINEKLLPYYLKYHILKAVVITEEFNVEPFFRFLNQLNYNTRIVRAFFDRKNNLELLVYNEKLNLVDYGKAIKRTREALNVGKMPPDIASEKWSLYYGAARLGYRIIKKKKDGKEVDLTQQFASRYWRTIAKRIEFFPRNTIPFFDILQYGTDSINLVSDRGGYPFPQYNGYDILGRIKADLIKEIDKFKAEFRNYIYKNFPVVDVYINLDELTNEELRKIFMDLLTKGVIERKKKRLLNFKKMYPNTIINSIKEHFQRLGYPKIAVEIFKTKAENFSIRARMPDGKFIKWRIID